MNKKKELIYDAIDKEELSSITKRNYKSRVNTLLNNPNFPDDIIQTIEDSNPKNNLSSEITITANILALANISKTFKKLVQDDLGELRELHDKLVVAKRKQDPVEKRENDVNWDYLLSLDDNLEKPNIKGDDRLIYHLYIKPGIGFIPRNDFAQMKLVDDMDETEDDDYNYYVRSNKTFLFNEYKTSARYGQIKVKAKNELAKFIPTNQNYMFEQGGEPMKDNSISKKIARAFKRLSGGKNISLVILRRAFATHIKDLPDDERRKIALQMGHSSTTNQNYSHEKAKPDAIDERIEELE
tara:strand:- start:7273 stop:8166 length:894 start_codon:yes stop_codon:yes gene_type:complete